MRGSVFLGILMASTLLAGCKDGKMAELPQKLPPIVLVQKVTFETSATEQNYSGTVKARIVSDQAFRVSGKVIKRLVSVGDRVMVGTILAELDTADLHLQLTQAEAEAQAAQKSLDQQAIETGRVEKLTKEGWSAQAALDRQNVATDEAQARLNKAKQNVALAQNALGYAALKSDSDGVVTESAVEPGQVIGVGQKAISIARDGALEAMVSIPETVVSGLADFDASFSGWRDPSKRYQAKLRELSPVADPATRTFATRFSIIDPDADLKLGMSGELHLASSAAAVAKVPLAAIFDQGKGPGVWHVDRGSGKIDLQPVTVANLGQTTASLSAGVSEGEYIVTLGAQKLDAGITVRAVDTLQR